jgi:hypothetical protein
LPPSRSIFIRISYRKKKYGLGSQNFEKKIIFIEKGDEITRFDSTMVKNKVFFLYGTSHTVLMRSANSRPLCTARSKNKTSSISYLETGHPNMSYS